MLNIHLLNPECPFDIYYLLTVTFKASSFIISIWQRDDCGSKETHLQHGLQFDSLPV